MSWFRPCVTFADPLAHPVCNLYDVVMLVHSSKWLCSSSHSNHSELLQVSVVAASGQFYQRGRSTSGCGGGAPRAVWLSGAGLHAKGMTLRWLGEQGEVIQEIRRPIWFSHWSHTGALGIGQILPEEVEGCFVGEQD
jgi:hypothetical protein